MFTVAVLVAANVLPLIGVLVWDWTVLQVAGLYWLENLAIGAITILKFMFCTAGLSKPSEHVPKLFLIPFFALHYGLFCFVHGVFISFLLGGESGGVAENGPLASLQAMADQVLQQGGQWAILALAGSHLFSFAYNYIAKGEHQRISLRNLMMAPYSRIVVLHMAILLGAFVVIILGSPMFLLLILIAGKIVLDIKMHRREHQQTTPAVS